MKYVLKFSFFWLYFPVISASLLRGTPDRNECCLGELAMKNFEMHISVMPTNAPFCHPPTRLFLLDAKVPWTAPVGGDVRPGPTLRWSPRPVGRAAPWPWPWTGRAQTGWTRPAQCTPSRWASRRNWGRWSRTPPPCRAGSPRTSLGGEKGAELESCMWNYLILSAATFDAFAQTNHWSAFLA